MQKIRGLINGKQDMPTVAIQGDLPDKDELRAMVADPRYNTDPTYRKSVEKEYERVYGT